RTALVAGALVAVGMGRLREAEAVTFTPVQPPTCPTTTNIDWNYRIGGKTGVFDLPSDPNCAGSPSNPCPHYINNLKNYRFFVSNSWVGYVAERVGFFSTETNFDFLKWGLDGAPLSSQSGSVGAGAIFWTNTSWSFGGTRALLQFIADGSVTFE